MKTKTILLLCTASLLMLASCSTKEPSQSTSSNNTYGSTTTSITNKIQEEEANYVVNVTTKCDKGHGGEKRFPVSKELCFYESSDGQWTTKETSGLKRYKSENLLLKIEDIDKEKITFSYKKNGKLVSQKIKFGEQFPINSNYDTYDGKRYSYRINFLNLDDLMVSY